MRARHLWGLVIAIIVTTSALSAEAGHRRRCCSSASNCSRGGWYHFTSGSGMYVPFATETVSTESSAGWEHGPTACRRCGHPSGYVQPVRYGRPTCSGCYSR